jgi:nucleoside phosphorylase
MENVKRYDEEDGQFIDSVKDQFNLLLITATKVEKETLHSYLKPLGGRSKLIKIQEGKQTYFLGVFGNYNIVHVSCDHMGATSPQASITTTIDAVTFCKPTVVVMVGIAFGAGGKQKIGDILVSESVVPYEIQRLGEKTPLNRGTPAPACTTLLNRFKNATDWHYTIGTRKPNIIPGLLLSGEKLIDNPEYKAKLLEAYPLAKGGEMEGYGVSTACNNKSIPHWVIVKGICDFADGKKARGKERKQKTAAEASINLCHHIFSARYSFKEMSLVAVPEESETPASLGVKDGVAHLISEVETEILFEMKEEITSEEPNSATTVQMIVRSFLLLDDEEKISIAKKIGVFDEELNQMYPHVRDKEIFIRIKERKALAQMWEVLNSISPFANSSNPFTTA